MRRTAPLIVGGGPAGSAAAIRLAQGGARPLILERQREIGDALCGGFLSWHTLASLRRLGVEPGGHPIATVRIFARSRSAEAPLPAGAVGLSRHRLDTLMLARAQSLGAGVEIEHVRDAAILDADAVFLATGKQDVRGLARPRIDRDNPTLGLRIHLPAHPRLTTLIGSAIELHLFSGGYAGLLLQEGGRANLCLAVRKSRLSIAGGKLEALFETLAREVPALGERLAFASALPSADAVASVPYGWRAAHTTPGLYRLGDQAAVIPSLAGEGIGIAIASGMAAARSYLSEGRDGAPAYQRAFAIRTRRPVGLAHWLWRRAETPWSAATGTRLLANSPRLAAMLADLTRISIEPGD